MTNKSVVLYLTNLDRRPSRFERHAGPGGYGARRDHSRCHVLLAAAVSLPWHCWRLVVRAARRAAGRELRRQAEAPALAACTPAVVPAAAVPAAVVPAAAAPAREDLGGAPAESALAAQRCLVELAAQRQPVEPAAELRALAAPVEVAAAPARRPAVAARSGTVARAGTVAR